MRDNETILSRDVHDKTILGEWYVHLRNLKINEKNMKHKCYAWTELIRSFHRCFIKFLT